MGSNSFSYTVYDYFNFSDNAVVTITATQNDGQKSRSIQNEHFNSLTTLSLEPIPLVLVIKLSQIKSTQSNTQVT